MWRRRGRAGALPPAPTDWSDNKSTRRPTVSNTSTFTVAASGKSNRTEAVVVAGFGAIPIRANASGSPSSPEVARRAFKHPLVVAHVKVSGGST